MIRDLLEEIKNEAQQALVKNKAQLEEFRIKFLGKKGKMNDVFEHLKQADANQKRELGKPVNDLKNYLQGLLDQFKNAVESEEITTNKTEDLSLPGKNIAVGSKHPLTLIQEELIHIFRKLGFAIADGPEIEDDWHNFSALNFPDNHPARDMQDTFFLDKNIALRTHTSSVQVRYMENNKPPLRAVMPGRVYRNEAISARANCFFHQIEGLYIDENVSFADLKQTLFYFVKELFGEEIKIRFRPSYFPFTEPSAEMDINCRICKGSGCNVCKYSGWVEILGCGMVDPNVLKNCGIDSEKYTGYAFGLGVERVAMLKYDVKDLRIYFENDLRFLKQFSDIS